MKARNLFSKVLAGLLALIMILGMVPVFASAAVSDDADVIRLPITIRDANQDNVLFENQNFSSKSNYVPTTIVNGVPQYNDAAIRKVASLVQNYQNYSTRNTDQNEYLYNALQTAKTAHSDTWSNTTSGADVTYLEDATTAYAAAKWMLSHLFVDGQYYADQSSAEINAAAASMYYTKTYPGYEELVLQPGTYKIPSGTAINESFNCYYYMSKDAQTNFTEGDDQIHNVTSGGANYANGGWYPLENKGFAQMTGETTNATKHNYHTTTAGSGQFVYHAADELFFAFTGDDDVFLYINDTLVINDGGIHGEEYSWIFLEKKISDTGYRNNAYTTGITNTNQTWAEYLGLEEGKIYNFNFFQMERNRTDSNFAMYTNIKVVDSSAVPAKKAYQNGQELIYGSFVPQNSEVTYGFEMTNNGGSNASAIKDLTFVDNLLGVNLNKTNPIISSSVSKNTYTNLEYAIYETSEDMDGTGAVEAPVYTKLTAETGEETLKSLLETGVDPGYTFSIRGFKYNVGAPEGNATTKTIVNTVSTTALGKANNSGSEKTLRGTATMRIRTWNIENKTFVMDYAKTMNLTNDAVFGDELTELSQGISVEEVVNSDTVKTTASLNQAVGNVSLDRTTGDYGTMTLTGSSEKNDYALIYNPTAFISGMDSYTVRIKLDTETIIGNADAVVGSNILNKSVSIVPANNVYYEDTFTAATETDAVAGSGIYFGSEWTVTKAEGSNIEDVNGAVMGWVNDLANDTTYSDGTVASAIATDSTVPTATFTFTGTGVDVYSRTNNNTGTIFVQIKNNDASTSVYQIIDCHAQSGDYYQIPTISYAGDYANYTVTIKVTTAAADRFEYYLDGVRIYNPLGETVTDDNVVDAYVPSNSDAASVTSVFKEVRDILLDAKSFGVDGDTSGAVFIDQMVYDEDGTGAATTATIGTYEDFGPKNEVYLKKDQAIIFAPASAGTYYVGLSSPTGSDAVANVTYNNDSNYEITVGHSSDLYYPVSVVDGNIIIKNTTDNLLCVTKIQMVTTDLATSGISLLSLTEENVIASYSAFTMRSAVPYTAEVEEDAEEETTPEEPTEPEVPEIDIGINNPKPDKDDKNDREDVKVEKIMNHLDKLFNAFRNWLKK